MKRLSLAAAAIVAAATMTSAPAMAETRVTLKSAASGTSYYVMMVQLGEVLKAESKGQIVATVEESLGSVQNIKEAAKRPGGFVFTTPPDLIDKAIKAQKPFEADGGQGYDQIRTLFVMPFITVHLVVRTDAGIAGIPGLAGKDFIAGAKGTACEQRTAAIFKVLGLAGKVNTVDVDLKAAGDAVRNRKVAGFATCSPHPTPQVQELASGTALNLLSFSPAELKAVLDSDRQIGAVTIAGGTYKGIDKDAQTVGGPVGAYATARMDDATAYAVVKAFWAQRAEMAKTNPWWAAVTQDKVALMGAKLHPGAARYYKEAGVQVPASMQ
ncbi:MAG: TAXI family TRAP transporter solute-binding subunit [Alphaproteobacteria bacterium]|nr:TAXI family TRAP transporter solute-binding subunit [Alphaproteobacteria bacterium]